jgi:chemotaxis protein methyltransferase WspC
MAGPDFEALLKVAMGLDASSLGPSAIARAVQARQQACGLSDPHAYYLRATADTREMQALVEAVVVPETWFFRDREAYLALADIASSMLLAGPMRKLRLLSLPCASGEEPFSMAIALIDAGVDPQRFRIDAVDISHVAIDAARRASYGPNSFRNADTGFRDRHFRVVDGKWQPADAVRDCVSFLHGNLFAPDFLPGQGQYDIILCRNVLIYFGQEMQAQAVGVLLRLLGPDGALFVGPSETGLLPRQKLASAQWPMAFAFRRQAPKPLGKVTGTFTAAPTAAEAGPLSSSARRTAVAARMRAAGTVNTPAAAAAATRPSGLAAGQALADQGRLAEAASACEQHLREEGASADAYCLLGLIREAAGDKTAAAMQFRKALYLEPRHAESLAHLALLLERQGDAHAAHLLRQRLRRLDRVEQA